MKFTRHVMAVHMLLAMSFSCIVNLADAASAQDKKPNTLVIMGDDIGMWNVSTGA